ncbi:hypothetical protein EXV98_10240 [Enterococcus faecium]|nr:hypothetical protein [Enterococcus faecium]
MKIGIIQILSTVNLFGKFTLSTPFFPILRDYQRSFHRYYLLFQMNLFKGVFLGSILFDVGELHQHLFCIKKYRKDTLKSFRINLATNS